MANLFETLLRDNKTDLPTPQQDDWKYTDLESILQFPLKQDALPTAIEAERLSSFLSTDYQLVVVNGTVQSALTQMTDEGAFWGPRSAFSGQVPQAAKNWLDTPAREQATPFRQVNASHSDEGILVYIPDNGQLDRPLNLILVSVGDQGSFVWHPRISVVMGKGAQAKMSVIQVGLSSEFLLNAVFDVYCESDANLAVDWIDWGGEKAVRLIQNQVQVQANAEFKLTSITAQGALTRVDGGVYFDGEHAQCQLAGMGILSGDSRLHHQLGVYHHIGHTESDQLYKTMLSDSAHAEYTGLVSVHPQAQKVNSVQMNRHLMLSDNAKAFSRPQLKIDADDVKCAHGATIGQLENDDIFYLQSRGLTREDAVRLLTEGFVREIADRLETPLGKSCAEDLIQSQLVGQAR